jgi:hypothetical protein
MERLSRLPHRIDLLTLVRMYCEQVELTFWTSVIPLLDESHPIGAFIQQGYPILKRVDWQTTSRKVLLSTVLGIAAGITLGFLTKLVHP